MKILLAAISTIAVVLFAASIRPAYSQIAGTVVKTTTYAVGDSLRGTVDAFGNIIDANGNIIGHLLVGSTLVTGETIAGLVSANGTIVDPRARIIGYIPGFAPASTTITKTVTTSSGAGATVTKEVVTSNAEPVVTREVLLTSKMQILPLAYFSVGDPSVDARRHELELRIGQDLVDNKLTVSQAADLRGRIDELVALEGNFMSSKGFLTNDEARVLFTRYDRIGSKLDESIAYNRRVAM